MRINKFVAAASDLSRRGADQAISDGRILINGLIPETGQAVGDTDIVTLDGNRLQLAATHTTIVLHKPVGYVCSRDGQGSQTVYDLLPTEYSRLNPVGRLDKDSSGLLVMTDDGDLANQLTHPRYAKQKTYLVTLQKPLQPNDQAAIEAGVLLEDGPSALQLKLQNEKWQVTMHEGRNRQIRRTFAVRGYTVTSLHRVQFGDYSLKGIHNGQFVALP